MDKNKTYNNDVASGISKRIVSLVLAMILVATIFTQVAFADTPKDEFQSIPEVGAKAGVTDSKEEKDNHEEDALPQQNEEEIPAPANGETEGTSKTEGASNVKIANPLARSPINIADGFAHVINQSGNYTITGTMTTEGDYDVLTVTATGVNITLDNVTIKTKPGGATGGYAPIRLKSGSAATIKLVGNNTLYSGVSGYTQAAALETDNGSKLTITADSLADKLTAHSSSEADTAPSGSGSGSGGGAGIGSSKFINGSTGSSGGYNTASIIITGGTIDARGGFHAAGVGGGWHNNFSGNIVIVGDKTFVKSRGGNHGAGIGGGCTESTYGDGSGTIVVAGGAKLSTKSEAKPRDIGGMNNYLILTSLDNDSDRLIVGHKPYNANNQKKIAKFTIMTDPSEKQGGVPLYLDLSSVNSDIKNAFKLAGYDDASISKLFFDNTEIEGSANGGNAIKYGFIKFDDFDKPNAAKIKIELDDLTRTKKGYKYSEANIDQAFTDEHDAIATLYSPDHKFDTLTGGDFTMEYGTTLPSQAFELKNTKNVLETDKYGEIPDLDFKIEGDNASSFTIENKKSLNEFNNVVGTDILAQGGKFTFDIAPTNQLPAGTYNLKVTAYSKFTEKEQAAGVNGIGTKELDFTFTVTKATNKGLINITANPSGGKINKAQNETGITITVTPVSTSDIVTEKTYTIKDSGGNIIVGPSTVLPDDGKVRFPDGTPDGTYTISVTGKSGDNIEDTKTFTYDVDISRPAVTAVTHKPRPGQVSGYIDDKETDIEITFSENIFAVDLANILDTLGGKFAIIGTPTITGGNKVNVAIKADKTKLANGDTIDLNVPENKVKDDHENLNTSGTGSTTTLTFSSYAPTISIPGIVENSVIKTPITQAIVEIKSNAKDGSADLYTTSTGTASYSNANIGNVVKVIGANGTPDPTYTLALVSGTPNKVEITFIGGVSSGDYQIVVDGKNIYNVEGEKAADITRNFKTRYPEIDSANTAVTIDRESFDANGGTATITVKGKDLEYADSFAVTSTNGKLVPVTVVGKQAGQGSGEVKIQVTFPPNAGYDIHDLYDLKLTMTTAGMTPSTVTKPVKSPDGSRDASVQVDRKKSIVKFDINGGRGTTPYFEQDKGDNAGKIDFKSHDIGKPNAPTKANHEFLGWYLGSELIRGEIDLAARGGGVYTLVAKYQDMSDLDNSGNVEKEDPEEDTAKYVDEVEDIKEIEKEIGGKVTIIPDPSDPSTAIEYEIKLEWDNTNVKELGVKTAVVYVVNPITGEKTPQKQNVYVYITARPYISVAEMIHVDQYDPITVGGIEWSPVVVEQVPDEVNKVIVLKNHPYRFHRLKFSSQDGMSTETVAFDAIITTYKGVQNFQVPMKYAYAYIVPRPVTGPESYKYTAFPYVPSDGSDSFGPTYNPANEAGSKGNTAAAGGAGYSTTNDTFWNAAVETLKNMQAGESYTINSAGGSTKNNASSIPAGYTSYAKIEVSGQNPIMSSAVLKELANMKNARFDVSYGNINYSFDSKDFAGKANSQTGYINFGYTEGNNNVDVNKLLTGRANQQLVFKASNRPVTLGIKLSKDLANKTNLNMFYFNASTGQLEIVGKMTVSNGVASIKLNGISSGTYAIVDGLSKSTGTSTSSTPATTTKNNDKVLSYRVTDITRLDDEATRLAIEEDLSASGKTIESISVLTASEETLEQLDKQEFKPETSNNGNALVAIASAVAIVGAGTLGVYVYFLKKKGLNIFKSLFNK